MQIIPGSGLLLQSALGFHVEASGTFAVEFPLPLVLHLQSRRRNVATKHSSPYIAQIFLTTGHWDSFPLLHKTQNKYEKS